MSIQKYEAFMKTAELGSFKKAAEALGYTQAGVSYMLKTLEEEMGLLLFIRDYGGVQLTAEGQQLLPWVRDVCNSQHRLSNKLSELKSLDSGVIRVAAFTSISIHWLPGMIHAFLKEYPKMEFDLRWSDDSQELEQLVQRGDVDCGFLLLPAPADLLAIPLKREPLLAVMSKDHPLATAPYFPTEELGKHPYIGLKKDFYYETEQVFTRHQVEPNIFITAENDYTVMALVDKGFGFSIFPELSLLSPSFHLIKKQLEFPVYRELAIAIRSYETASTATRSFLTCVQQWVKDFYGEQQGNHLTLR
ncbi:LysR family transcriptional regulator [Aminipila butyrica]|uniref:LysR family transcriptional regulator n=1 Tax=Aminipila butyrica TaxID=433296 RepID=A0A858BUV3_9FIRM|nr:LysR family transcriptional regulator [Aminipila butyrica]QIB68969.1 LysR family transcriptional regulator [Aminipila butyrica]